MDGHVRAFDVETGRELWKAELPAGGQATPMTYRAPSGRQFVVVAAGGGKSPQGGPGGMYVAYALPAPGQASPPPDPLAARVDPYVEKQRVVGFLAVEDNGTPSLTSFRRVILTIR